MGPRLRHFARPLAELLFILIRSLLRDRITIRSDYDAPRPLIVCRRIEPALLHVVQLIFLPAESIQPHTRSHTAQSIQKILLTSIHLLASISNIFAYFVIPQRSATIRHKLSA
jgi:hypothetical protein